MIWVAGSVFNLNDHDSSLAWPDCSNRSRFAKIPAWHRCAGEYEGAAAIRPFLLPAMHDDIAAPGGRRARTSFCRSPRYQPKPALNTFTDFFDTAKVYYAIRRQYPQWIEIRRSSNGSFGSKLP